MTRIPLCLCWLLLFPACGDGDRPVREHEAVRTLNAEESASMKRFATPEERFGLADSSAGGDPAGGVRWDWKLPPGWAGGLGQGSMRILDFTVVAEPEIQCYLSSVQGAGSTVASNVNRWAQQFGADPLDDVALAALPMQQLMGRSGRMVTLTGALADGMTEVNIPDAAMHGVVLPLGNDGCVTLKMFGPREAVLARRDEFASLAASIQVAFDDAQHAGAGGGPGASGGPGANAGTGGGMPMFGNGGRALAAEWPDDWVLEERAMRLMSFKIGESTELAVSAFGGGLRDNLNRWRQQMGLPLLAESDVRDLPKVKVLSGEGYLAVMDGHMRDGMTNTDLPGATMLGLIAPQAGGENLFVKMWGPAAEVAARRGEYEAFIASLTDGSSAGGGK